MFFCGFRGQKAFKGITVKGIILAGGYLEQ
jgi:hypothetical protein